MKEIAVVSELWKDGTFQKVCLNVRYKPNDNRTIKQYIYQDLSLYLNKIIGAVDYMMLIPIKSSQWSNDSNFVEAMKQRLNKGNSEGYEIEYENSYEYLIKGDMSHHKYYNIIIKFVEINEDDCVLLMPSLSSKILKLNSSMSGKILDTLWEVTQLNAIHNRKTTPIDPATGKTWIDNDFKTHLNDLWKTQYELYDYNSYESNKYVYVKKSYRRGIEVKKPIAYFFPTEEIDYNDLCYKTGEFKTYTLSDYVNNIQREDDYLVLMIRTDDEMQKLYNVKLN